VLGFEDYLREERVGGGYIEFHNKGVVFYAERPQFCSIDVAARRHMRFFIPSVMELFGNVIREMTGPMTCWTSSKIPANRYQRLVLADEQDYEKLKLATCKRPLEELPSEHQAQCRELIKLESKAASLLMVAKDQGAGGSPS
jgi:hypothetical protein